MNKILIAHLVVALHPLATRQLAALLWPLWEMRGGIEVTRYLIFGSSSVVASLVLFAGCVFLLRVSRYRLLATASIASFAYFYLWPIVAKGWVVAYIEFTIFPVANLLFALFVVLLPVLVGGAVLRRGVPEAGSGPTRPRPG